MTCYLAFARRNRRLISWWHVENLKCSSLNVHLSCPDVHGQGRTMQQRCNASMPKWRPHPFPISMAFHRYHRFIVSSRLFHLLLTMSMLYSFRPRVTCIAPSSTRLQLSFRRPCISPIEHPIAVRLPFISIHLMPVALPPWIELIPTSSNHLILLKQFYYYYYYYNCYCNYYYYYYYYYYYHYFYHFLLLLILLLLLLLLLLWSRSPQLLHHRYSFI